MADNSQWENIPESHKKILTSVIHNTDEFTRQAVQLGYSKETTGDLLRSFTATPQITEPLSPPTPTVTDKITDKLTTFTKNYGRDEEVNHSYAMSQLDQRQKEFTWNIDVAGDDFEQTKNAKTGKSLGEDTQFRAFWDDDKTGFNARVTNTPFEGLTEDQIEQKKSDLREQMRRDYLHNVMKKAGTLDEGQKALKNWNFTYDANASGAVKKQKGFLERTYETDRAQEAHFVSQNFTKATWIGKDTTLKTNGEKFKIQNGTSITKDPRFASLFTSTEYLNATPAQQSYMQQTLYGKNKDYILRNYQGMFPQGFHPNTDQLKKQLEQFSLRQIQSSQKFTKILRPIRVPQTTPLTSTGIPSSNGYGDLNRKTDLGNAWKHGAKKLARNAIRRDIKLKRNTSLQGRLLRGIDRLGLESRFLGEDIEEITSPITRPLRNAYSRITQPPPRAMPNDYYHSGNQTLQNAQSLVKRGLKKGITKGIKGIANTTKNIANLLERIQGAIGAIQGAGAAIGGLIGGGWIVIVIILIILLIIIIVVIIIMVISGGAAQKMDQGANPIPGLYLVKKGPVRIGNGGQLSYEIDVACTKQCQDAGSIIVYEETLPVGTTLENASGVFATSPYPVTWRLNDNTPTSVNALGEKSYIFHLTLNATASVNNQSVYNVVYGDIESGNSDYLPIPGLTLLKNGPTHVANGANITYQITAEYTGNSVVTLTDAIPPNTTFVSATGKFTNTNNTINWVLKDNTGPPYNFNLVLKPTSPDIVVTNVVYGTVPQGVPGGPGNNIVWLDSYAAVQFNPHFDAWVWAQCSQASMAEVFNAYTPGGPKYKIVDVETYGLSIGVWDPSNGLTFHPTAQASIAKEADHFGFKIATYNDYGNPPANADAHLNEIIATARAGHPVMLSAPGHWFVLWGADPDGSALWLLDSSGHDLTWAPNHQVVKMPRNFFLHGGTMYYAGGHRSYSLNGPYWTGLEAVLVPK